MKKIIDDIRLIYKCCSLYYEDNMSQQEISETLQISRPSVARMIKSGRRSGIVKIEIKNPDNLMFANMERELEKKFGLEEVVIAAANSTEIGPNIINENLAQEMAKFLTRIADLRQNAEAQKSAEKKNTLLLPRAPAYNQIKNRKGRSKP